MPAYIWKPFTRQYEYICRCTEAENTQVAGNFFTRGNSVLSKFNLLKVLISHGANIGIALPKITIDPLSHRF